MKRRLDSRNSLRVRSLRYFVLVADVLVHVTRRCCRAIMIVTSHFGAKLCRVLAAIPDRPFFMNISEKQKRLEQIAADMIKNNVCPDLAKTATHLVPGEGDPDASIVLIGEAPGKNEDLTGRPFVGAAGKFLTELLAKAGLTREEVFITSIVKYRPPNNRDPKPTEKEASWPYLLRQLKVIEPKIIVTLGRHSMGYFVPGQTIGQVHGKLITGGKWQILPVYHPAAALYSGINRKLVIEDFMKLKEIVTKLERKQTSESK